MGGLELTVKQGLKLWYWIRDYWAFTIKQLVYNVSEIVKNALHNFLQPE